MDGSGSQSDRGWKRSGSFIAPLTQTEGVIVQWSSSHTATVELQHKNKAVFLIIILRLVKFLPLWASLLRAGLKLTCSSMYLWSVSWRAGPASGKSSQWQRGGSRESSEHVWFRLSWPDTSDTSWFITSPKLSVVGEENSLTSTTAAIFSYPLVSTGIVRYWSSADMWSGNKHWTVCVYKHCPGTLLFSHFCQTFTFSNQSSKVQLQSKNCTIEGNLHLQFQNAKKQYSWRYSFTFYQIHSVGQFRIMLQWQKWADVTGTLCR